MNESRIELDLRNPQQAYAEILRMWAWAKPLLMAGHWLVLVIRLATRSDAQNRLLHSRLRDVSKHMPWDGEWMDEEDWKRLFVAAWCRVHNEGVRMVRPIDGHRGVDILFRRTSKLTRAECADLSEYILAWGSEREVPWCAASLAEDVPPPKTRTVRAGKHIANAETGEILETTA
jgi:hypothetical protein